MTQNTVSAYQFGDGGGGVRKQARAVEYMTPDGTKFVFPTSYNKQHQKLTVTQLLDAYNKVPAEIRTKGQKTIVVQDVYNPQDSYWRKTYKNFQHSYATGGEIITFWRYDYAHDPNYLVEALTHEMGHFVDWNGHFGKGKRTSQDTAWGNAMQNDLAVSGKKSPTSYGENSPVEDFAESVAEMAKDEKLFAQTFPNRYNILSGML